METILTSAYTHAHTHTSILTIQNLIYSNLYTVHTHTHTHQTVELFFNMVKIKVLLHCWQTHRAENLLQDITDVSNVEVCIHD